MSNTTQNMAASHSYQASQTHEKADKCTHANLSILKKASIRLYGKPKLVLGFKDIHPDPEIDGLIHELGSLLDEAWRSLCDLREEFPESGPMHFSVQSSKSESRRRNPAKIVGVKRSFSDYELTTVSECHRHQKDVGIDPMPATHSSDKSTQVFEEEFMHLAFEHEKTSPVKEKLLQRCIIMPSRISKPFFEVFEDKKRGATPSNRNSDPWILAGSRDLLHKRPVLATRDGTHPDALSRLQNVNRYVVNVHSVLNRGLQVTTYNEFPFTRERRQNTLRFRRGMIRRGAIIGSDGVLLSQERVDEYVESIQVHRRMENPFESVVFPRRFERSSNRTTSNIPSFSQRLGLHAFIPRIWIFVRPRSMFPRDIPSFARIPGERS
jgi:hypothetical protein